MHALDCRKHAFPKGSLHKFAVALRSKENSFQIAPLLPIYSLPKRRLRECRTFGHTDPNCCMTKASTVPTEVAKAHPSLLINLREPWADSKQALGEADEPLGLWPRTWNRLLLLQCRSTEYDRAHTEAKASLRRFCYSVSLAPSFILRLFTHTHIPSALHFPRHFVWFLHWVLRIKWLVVCIRPWVSAKRSLLFKGVL